MMEGVEVDKVVKEAGISPDSRIKSGTGSVRGRLLESGMT